MVVHWLRKPGRGVGVKLFFDGLGAVTTALALVIIIVAKFIEGAWITLLVAPARVFLLQGIRRHYENLAREVGQPLKLQASNLEPPLVIIPIDGWNRTAERAVRFALLLSENIIALHVTTEDDDGIAGFTRSGRAKKSKPLRSRAGSRYTDPDVRQRYLLEVPTRCSPGSGAISL